LKPHKHLFLLGSGLAEVAAKEGALKIKELTYLHCQALNLSANISNGFYSFLKAHPSPMIFVILEKSKVQEDIQTMKVM
jgi:glucosamine 6-phosphate synthetase-like amidotransferase/phosphosugar isomerase protein